MAKNSIRDYDATAANNTDVQSTDISEGCAASGINNAIREVMADLKDVSTGTVALETPAADSLTVTGDLTVDTNTLYVDSTNNRVGVGTTSPASAAGNALVVHDTSAPRIRLTSNTTGEAATDGAEISLLTSAFVVENREASDTIFFNNGAERMRVLSGGGLTFNGDTAAANALDDYEEGTWNPGVGGTATYHHQRATYTKVGNIVSVSFDMSINSIGTGSTTTMSGFPFASSSDVASLIYTGSVSYFAGLNSSNVFLGLYVQTGLSQCIFVGGVSSATTISNNGMGLFRDGARVIGSVTYRTA